MLNFLVHNHQETAASSSGSKVRAFFIGMGFLPGLVDKVIEENGTLCVSKML